MGSYTSQRSSLPGFLQEAANLYRSRSNDVSGHVLRVLSNLRSIETSMQERYGFKLSGQEILDIGAGQFLLQLFYFAQSNHAIGIDWDIIAQGMNPLPCL